MLIKVVKIFVTFKKNNIFVNVSSLAGKSLFKFSIGFFSKQYSKKKRIQKIIELLVFTVKAKGFTDFIFICYGFNSMRFFFIKEFFQGNFLPIPILFFISKKLFNGCRLKKNRRIL
jgi:hypothetical protein